MDQKNTIVKCNDTTCLFCHNGVCDQYIIELDMYGQCKNYVECEWERTEAPAELKSDLEYFDEDAAEELAALEILSESDIIKIKNLPKCKANCKYCSDRCGFPWCEKNEIWVDIAKMRCVYYEEV